MVLDSEGRGSLYNQLPKGQSLNSQSSSFPFHFTLISTVLLPYVVMHLVHLHIWLSILHVEEEIKKNLSLQNSFALSLFLCWDSSPPSCPQRLLGAVEMCISRTQSIRLCWRNQRRSSWVVPGPGNKRGGYVSTPFAIPAYLPLSFLPHFTDTPFTPLGLGPWNFELTNDYYIYCEVPVKLLTC